MKIIFFLNNPGKSKFNKNIDSLAGGVGPTLLRVIKRCSEIAGGRVPVWANWTAATFVGAWMQRMVSAVQVKNAQCVIAARGSRVEWCCGGCFVRCYSPICLKPGLYRVTLVVRNRIFS